MTKSATLFIAAAFTSFVAGAAKAQTTAFGNQDRVTDAIDDIEEDVQDSFDRDLRAFGNEGRTLGFYRLNLGPGPRRPMAIPTLMCWRRILILT